MSKKLPKVVSTWLSSHALERARLRLPCDIDYGDHPKRWLIDAVQAGWSNRVEVLELGALPRMLVPVMNQVKNMAGVVVQAKRVGWAVCRLDTTGEGLVSLAVLTIITDSQYAESRRNKKWTVKGEAET